MSLPNRGSICSNAIRFLNRDSVFSSIGKHGTSITPLLNLMSKSECRLCLFHCLFLIITPASWYCAARRQRTGSSPAWKQSSCFICSLFSICSCFWPIRKYLCPKFRRQ
uniref:Uncharacterized protein n=1 Tax=Arundo donax TaxID=35708 RepID=A0A0A9C2A9_ARUDO